MLVSEDAGRKTLHLASSAFSAAVYLELLTEPATSVIGLQNGRPLCLQEIVRKETKRQRPLWNGVAAGGAAAGEGTLERCLGHYPFQSHLG